MRLRVLALGTSEGSKWRRLSGGDIGDHEADQDREERADQAPGGLVRHHERPVAWLARLEAGILAEDPDELHLPVVLVGPEVGQGVISRSLAGAAELGDEVPAGRLYVDGGVVTPENGEALRERRHAAFNGMLAVSIVLDGRNRIVSGPQVRGIGLTGDEEYSLDDALDDLCEEAETAYKRLEGDARELDDAIENAISRAVKKAAFRIWERKPVVETTVLRI